MHIIPPKWDVSLIIQREPNKISSSCIRLKTIHKYMMSQTNILEYTRYANKTQHIHTHIWYKTKHAKGKMTYNKFEELKYKLSQ
jgi:hypothetical protein